MYRSYEELREKLLLAIENSEGFDGVDWNYYQALLSICRLFLFNPLLSNPDHTNKQANINIIKYFTELSDATNNVWTIFTLTCVRVFPILSCFEKLCIFGVFVWHIAHLPKNNQQVLLVLMNKLIIMRKGVGNTISMQQMA